MNWLFHTILIFSVFLPVSAIQGQTYHTQQEPLPCLKKTFSVTAYILRDTFGNAVADETAVKEQVMAASRYFDPICVDFKVCEVIYIDNFQRDTIDSRDEWRLMEIEDFASFRINMYFTVAITGLNPEACGIAGGSIIIQNNCINAKVIAHELGHFFSLAHTFEGNGIELVNGANCTTAGDQVCDTPADPFVPGDSMDQYIDRQNMCRFISQKVDANGEFYRPDVGNIMSYYPAECLCGFTHQQLLKMAANARIRFPSLW